MGALVWGNIELFLLGQFVMFFMWVIGTAVTYGRFVQTFKDVLSRLAVVETTVKRVDSHGTTFSQYNIKSEVEKIGDIIHRVEKVESNSRKLDVLVIKIENLQSRMFPKESNEH